MTIARASRMPTTTSAAPEKLKSVIWVTSLSLDLPKPLRHSKLLPRPALSSHNTGLRGPMHG